MATNQNEPSLGKEIQVYREAYRLGWSDGLEADKVLDVSEYSHEELRHEVYEGMYHHRQYADWINNIQPQLEAMANRLGGWTWISDVMTAYEAGYMDRALRKWVPSDRAVYGVAWRE